MAHVVSLIHRSLEAAQDARGHCLLLAAYVYYAFRLPGTEPGLLGGEFWWENLQDGKYPGGERPRQRESARAKVLRPHRLRLAWTPCTFCSSPGSLVSACWLAGDSANQQSRGSSRVIRSASCKL